MRLAIKAVGSLQKDMDRELGKVRKSILTGVKETGLGLKQDLRRQVTHAGLGKRLAYSWRGEFYPNKGLDAASYLYTKAPDIIRAWDKGAVIRARRSKWLAIPTDQAPKKGIDGKRLTPANFNESRYDKLRWVERKGNHPLLVVDEVKLGKTGKVTRRQKQAHAKSGNYKKGIVTVVMFIMVKQVRLNKKLNVQKATKQWVDKLPELIFRNMGNE